MNSILTDDQASTLVDILAQYAPDGWVSLKMHLLTDATHTVVTTWAVTEANPQHGFHLDAGDRAALDELIDVAWEHGGRTWNQMDFTVTSDGEFEIETK